MVEKIKKTRFNNNQLKELLIKTFEIAKPRAEEQRNVQRFASIIRSYGVLFPEDADTIAAIFGWETIEKNTVGRKMVFRPDVFKTGDLSESSKQVGTGCKDCPDNIKEIIDQYPDDDEVGEFELPEEWAETPVEAPAPTNLKDVSTKQDLEVFLGVGDRPAKDIIDELRSYLKNNNVDYDTRNTRSLQAFIDVFFKKVIKYGE